MDETNNKPSGSFICSFPDCHAAYNKVWKLEAHLCKHTGVRPFHCEFSGCSKSFCTSHHLARHTLTHTGERPYKCAEEGCNAGFTTNTNLKKHISRIHRQETKQYVCTYEGCGKTFKKNNQLKTHECTHTLLLPYQCSYEGCERRFSQSGKLKRHEKVHQGYSCTSEGCTFVAKTWTEMTKHTKIHKVRIQCDECKKTFRDIWFLRQHQQVHTGERLVFHCPRQGCTRSYTTAFNLQSHILSFHEEQRSFVCPHPDCGKSFSMKQSLLRHTVVHDPEKKKQKKPHPKRSLASRLSGHKPDKKHSTQTLESGETSLSQAGQSLDLQIVRDLDTPASESHTTQKSDLTESKSCDLQPLTSKSVVNQSKSICSEFSDTARPVVHFLEPFLL
ncbi:general transcription factor IIIAa [Misgurnus anguillicaudatus]|uniref:general transcription factor IIIAa n=1 Tax=Misgurnus anguillicaudatus TaxID=75329 RepID=UPI003CCF2A1A